MPTIWCNWCNREHDLNMLSQITWHWEDKPDESGKTVRTPVIDDSAAEGMRHWLLTPPELLEEK